MNDLLSIISLIASASSVALAIIAIWIALYGKTEADKTNQRTQDLLSEIRSDAKAISQVAMPELRAYGDSVRRYIFESDGAKSGLNASEIEDSINISMNGIRNELLEVKKSNDILNVKDRLKSLENKIVESTETIKKSVVIDTGAKDEGRIIIFARNNEYDFAALRSQWDEAIKRLLIDLNLVENNYEEHWFLINARTAVPVTKEAVFDSSIPIDKTGIRAGDKLYFKTQKDFRNRGKTI